MTYSEAVFNLSLLYPCISARNHYGQMSEQSTIISSKVDNRKTYYADGVIQLHELFDLEILLLETSGCFQNKDKTKISFDDIKRMFALLAMIKTVADRFSYTSVELFQKLSTNNGPITLIFTHTEHPLKNFAQSSIKEKQNH